MNNAFAEDAFWNDYRRLVARLMPPLVLDDGLAETEIAAAEARLGLKLPKLLREFYLGVGNREDINASFERLVELEELSREGEMLVFYEENQDVMFWGVKAGDPAENPPVYRAYNEEQLAWEPDSDYLSDFLVAMLLLQAVNGGMAFSGVGDANREQILSVANGWDRIELNELWGQFVLLRDGQALFVHGNDSVFGGGRSKADFEAITETFRVNWNYSTLDEEEE